MLTKRFDNLQSAPWNQWSTILGSGLWALIVLLRLFGLLALNGPEMLLLLAFFAITPLVLRLVASTAGCKPPFELDRVAMLLQPFAALCGGISLLIPSGSLAAITAIVWFSFTGLVALLGVTLLSLPFEMVAGIGRWVRERILVQVKTMPLPVRRVSIDAGNACLAMGLIYLPIGGAWFVVARLGIQPLGFSKDTILFTAAHFHYIPLAALTLTGFTGRAIREHQRRMWWKTYRIVAAGMIVYPLLVAAGITLDQLTGELLVETIAALLLAINVVLLATLILRFVVPSTASLLGKGLLTISGCAVLLSMSFAGAYALGNATGAWTITISQMVAVHGWVNALAFGFCGLAGWYIKQAQQE